MLKIFILLFSILFLIYLYLHYYISLNKIIKRNISTSNMIRFKKLNSFLNESSDDDIKDLISHLYNFLERRKKK